MSGKIYLVVSGFYSDFGVESVWTTREKADAEVVRLKAPDKWCDEPRVAEHWLDRLAEVDGVPVWQVAFYNNETSCERATGGVESEAIFIGKHHYQAHGNAQFLVRAGDEARAIKVAAERRASLLAAYAGRSEQPGEWVNVNERS